MVSSNEAFDRLVEANPAAVVSVAKPSAADFIAGQGLGQVTLMPLRTGPRLLNRGPLIGMAVFVVVVVVGLLISLNIQGVTDVVDTVPTPTSLPIAPSTTPVSTLQQVAEELAGAYSTGDVDAIDSLLADGAAYGWSRSSDFVSGPVYWTETELRARVGIDAALNTTIELTDCQDLAETRISCAILRFDDLVRAQGLEPVGDVRWRLTIDEGQIVDWVEFTPDISNYFEKAREPFHDWLSEAHPEVEHPATGLRGQPWRTDTGFAAVATDLVAEYAATLGVDLSGS